MKVRLPFIVAIALSMLAFLGACTKNRVALSPENAPRHFSELKTVAELLETQPDAALDSLIVLQQSEVAWTALDTNEFVLRQVQALYKNYRLTENSPDLTPVVEFYDSLAQLYSDDSELRFLRANAYYYKGVELAYASKDVEAFGHYQEALRLMKQGDEWIETPRQKRFIALIYTRLSEILYDYGLNEDARTTCREAYSCFDEQADQAAMKRYEAAIYQSEREYDKALACFAEAQLLSPVSTDFSRHAKGCTYYNLQQYDSAVYYLTSSFADGDRFVRADAASKLAEIYRAQGDLDKEIQYTRYYVESSFKEASRSSRKMEIEYLYDNFARTEAQQVEPAMEDGNRDIVLLAVLFALIVIIVFLVVRNRRRIRNIESQISVMEKKHQQENEEKDLEIKQMEKKLSDTNDRLVNAASTSFDESWERFSSSQIAQRIRRATEENDIMIKNVGLFPKLRLKEIEFIDLMRRVNDSFPDCTKRFLKDFPELNTADFRHCCLALLCTNDAEIAVLEGISYSGANRRTKKVLSAFETENTLQQAFLDYLKNNW